MILTSNRGFAEWGELFGDPVVATACSTECSTMPSSSTSKAPATGCENTPTSSPNTSAPSRPSRRPGTQTAWPTPREQAAEHRCATVNRRPELGNFTSALLGNFHSALTAANEAARAAVAQSRSVLPRTARSASWRSPGSSPRSWPTTRTRGHTSGHLRPTVSRRPFFRSAGSAGNETCQMTIAVPLRFGDPHHPKKKEKVKRKKLLLPPFFARHGGRPSHGGAA